MTATVKECYKFTNWRTYNESLVQRGDITFWFDEDVIDAWEHDNDEPKNGRPFTYSAITVECLLALRELFRLPYRQTVRMNDVPLSAAKTSWSRIVLLQFISKKVTQ